jgi:hypothetical protein
VKKVEKNAFTTLISIIFSLMMQSICFARNPENGKKAFQLLRQKQLKYGEMAEWLKATVLKTVVGATLPRVRIPVSPPF